MASVPDKIADGAVRFLPAPLARRLGDEGSRRFIRFVAAALAAVITSQIVLGLLTGPFDLHSAGAAGAIAAMVAALVSYLMSRWAWERKGKPDLLRETVPFWVISAVVVVVLTLATKLGYMAAGWLHLHGAKHVAFVGLVYLVANFITFLIRFVIFHYVLFAEPRTAAASAGPAPEQVHPESAAR